MKYMSRPETAAVKIADILGQKYRYRIAISKGDINPPLVYVFLKVADLDHTVLVIVHCPV